MAEPERIDNSAMLTLVVSGCGYLAWWSLYCAEYVMKGENSDGCVAFLLLDSVVLNFAQMTVSSAPEIPPPLR